MKNVVFLSVIILLAVSFWVSHEGMGVNAYGTPDSPPSRWEEFVTLGLTGQECETLILDSLDGDLANHPIPNLTIKMNKQRDPQLMSSTKWMFGVASTITGEVDCNLRNGDSVYPFPYEGSDGQTYAIPNIPCAGLNVLECCDAVMDYMLTNGIPTMDADGNCFSCWVHQQPLEPSLMDINNDQVKYVEHTYNSVTGKCEEIEYTAQDVAALDEAATSILVDTLIPNIDAMITSGESGSPVTCFEVNDLIDDIRFHGRSNPKAMTDIAGLFCGQCNKVDNDENKAITLETFQVEVLKQMKHHLSQPLNSAENCIIIYTDSTGDKVLKVPQVGGSLNDKNDVLPTAADYYDEEIQCPQGQMINPTGDGCMCMAVMDYDDLETYWSLVPYYNEKTNMDDTCVCPDDSNHEKGLFKELNHRCFCRGGFKIYNPITQACECPFGTQEDDNNKCICPNPKSRPDIDRGWNQVGWIEDNIRFGCRVDFGCSQSNFNAFESYQMGCNLCEGERFEIQLENGESTCIKNCDEENGFRYDFDKGECVCRDEENMAIYGGKFIGFYCKKRYNPDNGGDNYRERYYKYDDHQYQR